MSIVTDFKSIRRKLERQEQKAEFEAKNPPAFAPSELNAAARKYMASAPNRLKASG